MFWRALLEGWYQTSQRVHQIGLNWPCVSADISKGARQTISLFEFVDSTMNFGLNFVFQCLWTFFYHSNACHEMCNVNNEEKLFCLDRLDENFYQRSIKWLGPLCQPNCQNFHISRFFSLLCRYPSQLDCFTMFVWPSKNKFSSLV